MKKKFFSKYALLILIFAQQAIFTSCGNNKIPDVQFSYRGIIDKEYRFSAGRVIPVTISQSIETDGDISSDGNYFFYSSNMDGGNYDIYLRLMGDITTVRLTAHPSKDISPVISPDGKRLAFVSFRDDPEGDIFVLKIKPDELLKRASKGYEIAPLDREAVNITAEKQQGTEITANIKDSSPCWNHDGKTIAYSSSKGGDGSIWLMDSDGGSKRKISPKDGSYPSFSADGTRIIFVSYSDNKYGDIYSVEVASGKTERLTSGEAIKLYPSYTGGRDKIIYSSIENDTNRNGALDLQDRSVIRYLDLKSGLSYPLTKSSETSFKAKWLPVLNTRDYSGVIIYTDITGENINLNIIPESGIIPKKLNAKLQYELCETYLSEYDDSERYAMALESVYNFYGESSDNSSKAYVNRALKEAAVYYREIGDRKKSDRIISFIKRRVEKKDLYASFILDLIENRESWKRDFMSKIPDDKNNRYFAPFAMEDIADISSGKGDRSAAASIYDEIIKSFPEFERNSEILTKTALISDDLRRGVISGAAVKIINTGNTNQKISVTSNLVDPLQREKFTPADASVILRNIDSLKAKFSADKKIMAILTLASGTVNDSVNRSDAARADLDESIKLSHPNDLTCYMANIRLAEMERRIGRNIEAEKYYSAGINRYSRRFKTENFRDKLLWVINYYEQAGGRASAKRDFSSASQIYDKYINIITLMHNKRLYPEIYAEYAPRAHVLYIDSYAEWKGEQGINELEKSYSDKLPVLRMDFNRAALYGLAYIYTKKAMFIDSQAEALVTTASKDQVFENLYMAERQIEWALFLDDTFIEPYLLKSWIYQFVDLQRKEYGDGIESSIGGYFQRRLWEKNIPLLDRALNACDEKLYPENEGNIHINTGNSYFLLMNYPRALYHYSMARKYKKSFGSDIEKALFHFHFGYTLWQNGEVEKARDEISKAYGIYSTLSAGSQSKYKTQMHTLYRYFALFSRYEGKYAEAIDWYRKILKHAEDTGIDIDRARYMQEIALCFKETGDFDTAKSYIDQADRLLRDYSDDTRKYYLTLSFFGIGPFPVWNMGPDTAVIGDNRIFYPLDTWNKKLLSLSMLEDMSAANSDYSAAIGYLKKKLSLLEESKTSVAVETRIRSLNNLGYYFFRSGNAAEAEKLFIEAGYLAEEKSNREAMFSSIMNLANLYAMLIEDKSSENRNWLKDTELFLSRIEKYRNDYYSMTLAQEREELEASAKAKKLDVTKEQIDELKERVEKETTDVYHRLDTSIAVMKFYRAELLYSAVLNKKSGSQSYDLYTRNRDIYNLYADALRMFEGAISVAEKQGNIELKVKLLLNAASCYERISENEKAYVALIDAKNLSDQYRLGWTGINSYYATGSFLERHGKEVESGEYIALAEKHISSAISRIEEHPLLYSSRPGRIRRIYNGYSVFLIKNGKNEKAFLAQERLTRVERIISVNSLSPVFSDEYDRTRYLNYLSGISRLTGIREKLAALLVTGALPASPEIEKLNRMESEQEERLGSLMRETENKSGRIAPYLELKNTSLKTAHDIYTFIQTDDGIYCWKLSDGKISGNYLKSDFPDAISSLISGGAAGRGVFILINETSLSLVNRYIDSFPGDFSLLNCIDRADVFSRGESPAGDILSAVKGIERPSPETAVDSADEQQDLSRYAVVVDYAKDGRIANRGVLFSRRAFSPCNIIMAGTEKDSASLSLMLEGALYSGTNSVIYSLSDNKKDISAAVKALYSGSGINGTKCIRSGYINSFNDKKPADSRGEVQAELFNASLERADFEKAAIHLARWSAVSTAEKYRLMASKWLLEILKGDHGSALSVLDSYSPANAEEGASLIFRRMYTLLHKGDFAEAIILRKKITGLEKYQDLEFIDAIIEAVHGRNASAERILKISRPYSTLIPAERYLILAAEYIYLFNPEMSSRVIDLSEMKHLSLNERMMNFVITGEKPVSTISPRIDRIINLSDSGDSMPDESLKLVKSGEGFDSISVFPPLIFLSANQGKEDAASYISGLDLENIVSHSFTPAAIALLQRCYSAIPENGTNTDKLRILRLLKKISSDSSVFHVIRESMFRIAVEEMTAGEYDRAYREALAADARFAPDDMNYAAIQLLLANLMIMDSDYKKAAEKCAAISSMKNLRPEEKYLLDLQLSMIELGRLRTLKKATQQDAVKFERIFSSALGYLKGNPGVLNIHGYRAMTENVFDEYINYKMKTGQHSDALYYNEMKKLLIASSVTGVNLVKSAGTIDIAAIQQAIPERCGYINIAKVKNDIFIWIVDSRMKKALWIEGGYKTMNELLQKHRLATLKDSDVRNASEDLYNFFEPLAAYFKSRKRIIISPDFYTEQIPFEITGKDKMLSEEVRISYMASPLLLSSSRVSLTSPVQFIGKEGYGFQSRLEKVAVNESGIKNTDSGAVTSGIAHITGDIKYSSPEKGFTIDGVALTAAAGTPDFIYVSLDEYHGAGPLDFSLAIKTAGVKSAVINRSPVSDLNRGIFAGEFYRSLGSGASLADSFASAIEKTKSDSRYGNPAAWSGFRLYIYNFGFLRE